LRFFFSRHQLRDYERRDEKDGRAASVVKNLFAQCLLDMLPVLQSTSIADLKEATIIHSNLPLATPLSPQAKTPSSKAASSSSAPSSSSSISTTQSSYSSFNARVERAKSILRFARPFEALTCDSMAVEAEGAQSVLASVGPIPQKRREAAEQQGQSFLSSIFGSSTHSKSSAQLQQQPLFAHDPAVLGSGAVPMALNGLYAPFNAHELMAFDPLASAHPYGDGL
jgi:hypothetical protein